MKLSLMLVYCLIGWIFSKTALVCEMVKGNAALKSTLFIIITWPVWLIFGFVLAARSAFKKAKEYWNN